MGAGCQACWARATTRPKELKSDRFYTSDETLPGRYYYAATRCLNTKQYNGIKMFALGNVTLRKPLTLANFNTLKYDEKIRNINDNDISIRFMNINVKTWDKWTACGASGS